MLQSLVSISCFEQFFRVVSVSNFGNAPPEDSSLANAENEKPIVRSDAVVTAASVFLGCFISRVLCLKVKYELKASSDLFL